MPSPDARDPGAGKTHVAGIPKSILANADGFTLKRLLEQKLNPGSVAGSEPGGLVDHPDKLDGIPAGVHIIAKDCMEQLAKRYPGFVWGVQPSNYGQVLNVFCLNFNSKWGYTILLTAIQDDPRRTEAIKAGRELLRRFRYDIDRYDPERMAQVKRDRTGQAIPDLSDQKRGRYRTAAEIDLAIAEGRAQVYHDNGKSYVKVTT